MPRSLKVLACGLAATAIAAAPAHAIYAKPSGTYKLSFFGESGGTLKVKQLKVTKLRMRLPERDAGFCDGFTTTTRIGLAAKPKLRKFNDAGGRYAYGKVKSGLIEPKAVIFTVAGHSVGGTLKLLWDESAKILTSGEGHIGDCAINFTGHR